MFMQKRLLFVWLILLFFQPYSAISLNSNSVFFIDKLGNNWLFRGNSPVSEKGMLEYDTLKQALAREAFRAKGMHMPAEFFIVDISFMLSNDASINAERNFFIDNPEYGIFLNWPIFGLAKPENIRVFGKKVDNVVPNEGSLFSLLYSYEQYYTQHVALLINMLNNDYGHTRVFYVHCNDGCDRVSEIIGAYRMQRTGMSIGEANALTSSECSGIHYFSKLALEWYCYYLRDQEGSNRTCMLD